MTAETNLKPLYSVTATPTRSQSSMPSLTRQSVERMEAGKRAAKKIISSFPDYGKAPPEYVVNLAESLSYLNEEELAVILHPINGVIARTKFLPTFADISAVLVEHRAKQEQFKPAHTQYKRLTDEQGPWDRETDYERKARVVRELLGYNPSPKAQQMEGAKRTLEPPTAEDLRNLKLKTLPGPISRQLREKLEAEGWQFVPPEEKTA
jgi:hypothetical protein